MIQFTSIEAAAIFGSSARGSKDAYSDTDVLLIGPDSARDTVHRELLNRGYSPSYYNWAQLRELARSGSVFLQHLKLEAKTLFDRTGRFTRLINEYEQHAPLSAKLLENHSLVLTTAGAPVTGLTLAWALDVLCVAVRNFAVLKNAQRGVFVFDYSSLVDHLSEDLGLGDLDHQALVELRIDKYHYRTFGVIHGSIAEAQARVVRVQRVLAHAMNVPHVSVSSSIDAFVSKQLRSSPEDHWYVAARRAEGAFRAIQCTSFDLDPANVSEIERLIKNPSPYGVCAPGAANLCATIARLGHDFLMSRRKSSQT
jgi:hypothetical protein